MMPTHPGAGFIMIHADFAFGFFENGFDRPALTTQVSHRPRRDPDWGVAQVILSLGRFRETAPKDGPDPRAGQAITNQS